jgi:hypothetical protein
MPDGRLNARMGRPYVAAHPRVVKASPYVRAAAVAIRPSRALG